jgi:hypothetical protein
MSCKSLLVLGALMIVTMRATAAGPSPAVPAMPAPTVVAAPLPAVPEVPPAPTNATGEAPPEPGAYTMTIYNGPRVVQKTWVPVNGSWRSYRVLPACPSPCGTYAPSCAAKAPCARQHCGRPSPCGSCAPPCEAKAPCVRQHCS